MKPCESVHAPSRVDNICRTQKENARDEQGRKYAFAVLTPSYKKKIADTLPKNSPPMRAHALGAQCFSLRKKIKKSDLK